MMSFSLQSGLTQTFACGVGQPLHLQIESTTVVIAGTCFVGPAPVEVFLFLI